MKKVTNPTGQDMQVGKVLIKAHKSVTVEDAKEFESVPNLIIEDVKAKK